MMWNQYKCDLPKNNILEGSVSENEELLLTRSLFSRSNANAIAKAPLRPVKRDTDRFRHK